MFTNFQNTTDFWINFIISTCSSLLIFAVLIDFIFFEEKDETKNKKKSKVATGNMFLFFISLYFVWFFKVGKLDFGENINLIFQIIGIFLVILGTIFNIVGRFYLSTNWANHIKIYKDHFLVKNGVYKIVRHPLYASLIWFGYGISFAYLNYLDFILVNILFIPMMYYRAKQEEEMLIKNFPDYENYKSQTGMFFPKIF